MIHTQDLIIIYNFYLKGFSMWYRLNQMAKLHNFTLYRVLQGKSATFWDNVPKVKSRRYNKQHVKPNLNCYGKDGGRRLKEWELLHIY